MIRERDCRFVQFCEYFYRSFLTSECYFFHISLSTQYTVAVCFGNIKPESALVPGLAALLFWFFGDFRCGALLFMVIHVIYKYKNK